MKNRKKTIFAGVIFCAVIVAVLFYRMNFGVYSRQIFAMDTYCSLEIRGGGEKALDELEKIITDYDVKYNAYNPRSVIYSLNDSGESADEETVFLAKRLLEYNKKTYGAFDFSLKKLSDLWGFSKKSVKEPEKIDFSQFGAEKVKVDQNRIVLYGVEVDFGGVMKGYVTDKLCEKLEERGISDAILNLGGNVLALGEHKIGIQNPDDKNSLLCTVAVCDKAVVTSGIYQRTFSDQNGIMRHHILNPESGYPADSGVVSVTVIGNNATECDVLSTAFLVLGKDKTAQLYNEFDVGVIMLTEGNNVYCSHNISDVVEVSEGYTKEVL